MLSRRAVDEAIAALDHCTRDRAPNAFASVALPRQFDPRKLLETSMSNDVVASYERSDQGVALVGVGEAARVDLANGDLPTVARTRIQELLADVRVSGVTSLRPRVLGGFRFAPEQHPGEPWEQFSAGSLVLPKMLFVLDGENSGVVLAPGTALSEARPLIEEGLRSNSTDRRPSALFGELREIRSIDEAEWLRSVRTIAREIRAGEYEKAVLATSIQLEGTAELPIGATLAHLRADYPDCHIVSFQVDGSTIVCASPELLVKLEGRQLETAALAASQRRSINEIEDAELGHELLTDPKSRGEHEVVVREIVERLDDLTLSLDVDPEPAVRRFRNIQHLLTKIVGAVPGEIDILDLVERLHPTPAVCGRPFDLARRVITEHETFDRGWYAGPIGWLDANGDGEFAVALRTALLRGTKAWLFAGNGIMGDSNPDAELEEVRLKLHPLAEALNGRARSERNPIPA